VNISKEIKAFLKKPNFMVLGTTNDDGSIQMSPVWYEYDNEVFLISTTTPRAKHKNLQNNPKITFVIYDNENPYRYISMRGTVDKGTKEGGHDMIDKLAKHYLGKDKYPWDPKREQDRITYTITPSYFHSFGF